MDGVIVVIIFCLNLTTNK